MEEFRFPDVAEGLHEGKLVEWKVKEGDHVTHDQVLCEMETDKTVLEIPSPHEGIIAKLHFNDGDMVKVGEVLVTFGDEGTAPAKSPTETPAANPTETPVDSPAEEPAAATPSEAPAAQTVPATTAPVSQGKVRCLPKDRKLARSLGVDISTIAGSGNNGRVTATDIKAAAGEQPAQPAQSKPTPTEAPKTVEAVTQEEAPKHRRLSPSQRKRIREGKPILNMPIAAQHPTVKARGHEGSEPNRQKITGARDAIRKHMDKAWRTIPHAGVIVEIQVDKLMAHRAAAKGQLKEQGIKLTYLAYILRVVADALENFPVFNAYFDETKDELVYHQRVDIGVAVDTDYGLVVPNIRDCNKKSVAHIAKDIQTFAEKARNKKLAPSEIEPGTLSITNIGSFGAVDGVGIINYPATALLMVGRIKDSLVVKDGKPNYIKVMPFNLTFDHRFIDGADAGRFLNFMRELLEDPQFKVEWGTE